LRVKTFTGDPLALADYGPLYAKDGRAFEITDDPAGQYEVVVVRFKGVADRNAAEALAGTELFVDRSACCRTTARRVSSTTPTWSGWPCATIMARRSARSFAVQNFGGGDILDVTAMPGARAC
jgi:16S rRNA processing protein RimM